METLGVEDGFDIHDYREGLKLLQQDSDTWTAENRAGLGCPACERPFERLFVAARETVTFDSAPNGPICLARSPGKLLVLTH